MNSSINYKSDLVEPMQNPDKTTARIECWTISKMRSQPNRTTNCSKH